MITFQNPIAFIFLCLIPLYFINLFFFRKKVGAVSVSVLDDLKKAQGSFSLQKYLNIAKHTLLIVSIILFTLALARPQGEYEQGNETKKSIDIVITLDVSESMLAEDLKPNRIEAAKESIKEFISRIDEDRIAITVFAGQAFTQSPLTFDHEMLNQYVDGITTSTINQRNFGAGGTAVGDAILSSISRFKADNSQDQESNIQKNENPGEEKSQKVIILLTDGDANKGIDPNIAAAKASNDNIKIYTIGIGKEGGAPIPITDMLGRKSFARDSYGKVFISKFNEDSLKKIAKTTNGRYFRAGDNKSFDKIMKEIASLEKKEVKINKTTNYTEEFDSFLLWLMISLLAYQLIEVINFVRR